MLGRTIDEINGSDTAQVTHPDDVAATRQFLASLWSGHAHSLEVAGHSTIVLVPILRRNESLRQISSDHLVSRSSKRPGSGRVEFTNTMPST
jgi:hypothetical protein